MPEPVTGVTVESVRGMLAGIPSLTFLRSGPHAGLFVVEDEMIGEMILTAESMIGAELDLLLGLHEVRCVQDHDPAEELPPRVLLKPALDKPRNWFEGDRWGSVDLPALPVRAVKRVTVYPSGWSAGSFEVPLGRVRAHRKGFKVASSALAMGNTAGWLMSQGQVSAPLAMAWASDGRAMPGGIEVIYTAGMTEREIADFPVLKTMARTQALILLLSFYQAFLGGGVQKEAAGVDGMSNAVETARRDVLGPLGGEIKALKATYEYLLGVARMRLGGAIATAWTS